LRYITTIYGIKKHFVQSPKYIQQGFKPIRCRGYHSKYNPKEDYKAAKEPVDNGFTSPEFVGCKQDVMERHVKDKGWIGFLLPEGVIALDLENIHAIRHIEAVCKDNAIEPAVHITNNGSIIFSRMINKYLEIQKLILNTVYL
jgi:hypothetical protein